MWAIRSSLLACYFPVRVNVEQMLNKSLYEMIRQYDEVRNDVHKRLLDLMRAQEEAEPERPVPIRLGREGVVSPGTAPSPQPPAPVQDPGRISDYTGRV